MGLGATLEPEVGVLSPQLSGRLRTSASWSTQATFEHFMENMLDDLREAMPVDGVYLALHGAMAARLDEGQRADAVPLDLEQVVVGVERRPDPGEHRRDEVGQLDHRPHDVPSPRRFQGARIGLMTPTADPPPPGTVERWAFDYATGRDLAAKLAPPPPPVRWQTAPLACATRVCANEFSVRNPSP